MARLKCKHKFTVVNREGQKVRVGVASLCSGDKQWTVNGILTFTEKQWKEFAKWVLAMRANCEIVE